MLPWRSMKGTSPPPPPAGWGPLLKDTFVMFPLNERRVLSKLWGCHDVKMQSWVTVAARLPVCCLSACLPVSWSPPPCSLSARSGLPSSPSTPALPRQSSPPGHHRLIITHCISSTPVFSPCRIVSLSTVLSRRNLACGLTNSLSCLHSWTSQPVFSEP